MSNRSRSSSPTMEVEDNRVNTDAQMKEKEELSSQRRSSRSPSPPKQHSPSPEPKESRQYSPSIPGRPEYVVGYSPTRPHYNGSSRRKRARSPPRTRFTFNGCGRCGFGGHSSRDCRTIQCSKCRGYGHRQRDCVTIVCNGCTKLGHTVKECRDRADYRAPDVSRHNRGNYGNRGPRSHERPRQRPRHQERPHRQERPHHQERPREHSRDRHRDQRSRNQKRY